MIDILPALKLPFSFLCSHELNLFGIYEGRLRAVIILCQTSQKHHKQVKVFKQ